ncbi:transport protein particle component [Coniophora puteana RWD-64-598 SS2]|uniref:Transport protein particle component n=1 Tax=Coniophora puteana (strain RWD-64-598) TaxID=741705 RepID=A0A5M3N3R6_CONPW|nr:transport protein particle component [Coniophora puteana RWD-64-598 SS2]EIW86052.1 transport protein particle component [Coniophora puteana RWD-64-598 SS2]
MSRLSLQQNPSQASSSQVATTLTSLGQESSKQVDGAALEYLLIEAIPVLRASSAVASARRKELEREMAEAGIIVPPPNPPPKDTTPNPTPNASTTNVRDSAGSARSVAGAGGGAGAPVDEAEEALRQRLESIGMHIGANITERLARDRQPFGDTLDVVKFVCKDLWTACWDKQIDNLRTNHRGVYVLQDNAFKPLMRLSSWEGRTEALRRAKTYVALPAGIIRGSLGRLGLPGTVTTDITSLPQCTFHVKLPKNAQ